MSFTINVTVAGGVPTVEATSGGAAPPDGNYTIAGHQYTGEGSADDYAQVTTPFIQATASRRGH